MRKGRLVLVFTFLCFLAGALIVVNRAHAQSLGFSYRENLAQNDLTIRVYDDVTGVPVDGAEIRFEEIADMKIVQVTARGYAGTVVAGAKRGELSVYLRKSSPVGQLVIASGKADRWTPNLGRDYVQAGFAFRALNASDLLSFNLDSFVSPIKDRIDVFGPRDIPSNTMLPRQDIFAVIGTIRLDKPTYRLPLEPGREVQLAGIQGYAKVTDLLPAAQGGFNVEMLNKLKFTRVGYTPVLQPGADFTQDIQASLELAPNQHLVTVSKPPFVSDVIVAGLSDIYGDRRVMVPTDLKTAINAKYPNDVRTVGLSAPTAGNVKARNIVAVAMSDKGKRVSAVIVEDAKGEVRSPAFMDAEVLPDSPSLPESLDVSAPATGVGTVIFEAKSETSTYPLWYLHVLPAAGKTRVIPTMLPVASQVNVYSVSRFDFGSGFDPSQIDGRGVFERLERFTRSTAMIKQSQLQ